MIKLFSKFLWAITFASLAGNLGFARKGGTVPGGILHPTFASAALVNASSLTSDWRTEFQTLYSLPINDHPNGYLLGYATSSRWLGVNLGYSGSTSSGSSYNNVFGGLSLRWGNLCLGVATRRNDIIDNPIYSIDASATFHFNRKLRLGIVGYDVNNPSPLLGLGISLGRIDKRLVEIDFLASLPTNILSVTKEYAINTAFVAYFGRFGTSLGVRYTRLEVWQSSTNSLSANASVIGRISKSWNVSTTYDYAPRTISIALTWASGPSIVQRTGAIQSGNRYDPMRK